VISVERLGLAQGNFRLDDVSFEIASGQYAVLMGRTGSGKTTILEAIAGLRAIRSGRIVLDGRDVAPLTPAARGLGYVPQDGALFTNRTVFRNLSFALELRGVANNEIRRRVEEIAGWLGIDRLLERSTHGLSGGEAQRVALGRALIFEPPLLLLDEPLAALDEETRDQLIELLQSLRRRGNVTVLHITHSSGEAELLGDLRYRLEDGVVRDMAPASPRT
jgi:molybdate/tungstate transport system ATP-binding protein